jgi:hypothetical protein
VKVSPSKVDERPATATLPLASPEDVKRPLIRYVVQTFELSVPSLEGGPEPDPGTANKQNANDAHRRIACGLPLGRKSHSPPSGHARTPH